MAEFSDIYINGINKKYHDYYVAWMPTKDLHLGDYGIVKNNIFDPEGNIKKFKIDFEVLEDTTPGSIDHSSASSVVFHTKVKGEANQNLFPHIPKAEAGIKYEFGTKNSFIIKAKGVRENRIVDRTELFKAINNIYDNGNDKWNLDWFVITDLIKVSSFRLIIAKEAGSEIELSVSSDFEIQNIDLANADIDFNLKYKKGDVYQEFFKEGTPFFRLHKLEKHFSDIFKGAQKWGQIEKSLGDVVLEKPDTILKPEELTPSNIEEYFSFDLSIPAEINLE